jgi:hypothetical protein
METTEIDHAAAQNFVMPVVDVGCPVSFYPNAQKDQYAQLCFVVRISKTGRNVMLRNANGQIHEGCRHYDDPKLDWNVDHRENGCWDFTDEWKRSEEQAKDILSRLEAVEKRLSTAKTTKPNKADK